MTADEIIINGNLSENAIEGRPLEFSRFQINFKGTGSKVILHEGVICHGVNLDLFNNSIIEFHSACIVRGSYLSHNGCKISLGKNTRCNGNLNIRAAEATSVLLGENCLIASATLRSSDMHPIFDMLSHARLNPGKNITIGDHVWLGQDSYISKGVIVGNGSVIAAHAVVTKNVPPNCAVGGNPAKVLRENIYWNNKLPT